jgi:putative hydrolase of the HAD superfamily
MAKPRLILFDLGNVLVRICRSWEHACQVAGVPVPARKPDGVEAHRLHELVLRADRGQVAIDDFCAEAAALFHLTPADVRRMSDAYVRGHLAGAVELLEDLRSRGLQTACLSNTNDNHWDIMSRPPYRLDLLTYRFASHLIGQRKPDRAVYEALERMTGTRGDEILFFDDLHDNIQTAQQLGWKAHLTPAPTGDENWTPIPWLQERIQAELT